MAKQVYREKAMEKLSSPEQLNDYLRVTQPAVWVTLTAVILLLIGAMIWSSQVSIDSRVSGTVTVHDGKMIMTFERTPYASYVSEGLSVEVGSVHSVINSVGVDENGRIFAQADTMLADGTYPATVCYKQTQIMKMLFDGDVSE